MVSGSPSFGCGRNSISSSSSVVASIEAQSEALLKDQKRLVELHSQVVSLAEQVRKNELIVGALTHLQKNTPMQIAPLAPSELKRKAFECISPHVRALIAEKVVRQGSMSYEQAAAVYNVSKSSVGRVAADERKRVASTEPAPPPQKRGRKTPITIDAIIHLLVAIEKNSVMTLKNMVLELKEKFNIDSSVSAIDRALSQMDITWKNVLKVPFSWNSIEVISSRKEYLGKLGIFAGRELIYLDESGFHLHIHKSRGRALVGQKATLSLVPKGNRISLIAAMGLTGYVHQFQFNSMGEKKRGVKAEDFRSFLLDLAPKCQRNCVLVLDNCKIHHAAILKATYEMLKATYGIDHLFLPPYSPFLNPIELSFNTIKAKVASCDMFNRGDLIRVLESAIASEVTAEHCVRWFKHAAKFYPQCGMGLPFHGCILNPELTDVDASLVGLPVRPPPIEVV